MANGRENIGVLKEKGSGSALLRDAVSASVKSIGANGSEKRYVELPVMLEALQRLRQKKKSHSAEVAAEVSVANFAESASVGADTAEKADFPSAGAQPSGESRTSDARKKRILIKGNSVGVSPASYSEKSSPRRFGKWSRFLLLLLMFAAIAFAGIQTGLFTVADMEALRDRLFSEVRTNTATLCEDVATTLKKKEGDLPTASPDAAGKEGNSAPIASARAMPPSFARLGATKPTPLANASSPVPLTAETKNTAGYSASRTRKNPDDNTALDTVPSFGDPDRLASRKRGREDPFNYDLTPKNRQVVAAEVVSTNPFAFAVELKLLALKSAKGAPATAIVLHLPTDTTFYVKCGDSLMFTDKNNIPRDLKVVEITTGGVKVSFGQGLLQTVVLN